jgi:dTDP-4-dehydrorhamnose 3,5-epimerase-like enzyme
MKVHQTELSGVLVIIPDAFGDSRGYFLESFNEKRYSDFGIPNAFVQDNISKSKMGTVRGLHYQIGEFAQGKLCILYGKVRCCIYEKASYSANMLCRAERTITRFGYRRVSHTVFGSFHEAIFSTNALSFTAEK